MPCARPCARSPKPSPPARAAARCARHRQSGAPRAPGDRARAGARRRQRRPPSRRRPDRRRPRPAGRPLVSELTAGHPERIRICASDTCQWVFYDTSRTGRRRWCDMATCGNRAKAARHRARQGRGDGAGEPRRTAGTASVDSAVQPPRAWAGPRSPGASSIPRRTATGNRRSGAGSRSPGTARAARRRPRRSRPAGPSTARPHHFARSRGLDPFRLGARVADDHRADAGRPLDLGRVATDRLAVLDEDRFLAASRSRCRRRRCSRRRSGRPA